MKNLALTMWVTTTLVLVAGKDRLTQQGSDRGDALQTVVIIVGGLPAATAVVAAFVAAVNGRLGGIN